MKKVDFFYKKKNKNKHKSGYIGIVGIPNSGKSTLLNSIIGEKISITSKKAQTTRNSILSIFNKKSSQLVFIDTPGVNHPSNLFDKKIKNIAMNVINEVELLLLVVDISKNDFFLDIKFLNKIKVIKKSIILVLNKIDRIKKNIILQKIEIWLKYYEFIDIIPISAKKGDQINFLINIIERFLPLSPPLFPAEYKTSVSNEFIISEIIREKILRFTGDEIPYSVMVTIDNFIEKKNSKFIKIFSTIHVEEESQKKILIGKGGGKLKIIGINSRFDIEKLLSKGIFLQLFVRVEKKWSKNLKTLRRFGF